VSHHFDTPTAREDPRLNLCDMYLFAAGQHRTVMAMTVNPAATPATRAPFRSEAVYAFHFEAAEERGELVSFKVRFDESDAAGFQQPELLRANGTSAAGEGDVIATAQDSPPDVRVFAGVVGDAFAGDAAALERFKDAYSEGRYEPQAFTNRVNFFADRSIAAIVVEVPNTLIGANIGVRAWSTVTLSGHAPDRQVARWGLPLFTHIFLPSAELRERFNRTTPHDDAAPFLEAAQTTISGYTGLAGTTADPDEYARRVVGLFGNLTLPYQIGTTASFDFAGFNGRGLRDNVMDVVLTLLTNSPLGTGIAPNPRQIDAEFPYLRSALTPSLD
jgi:hypothetical protein